MTITNTVMIREFKVKEKILYYVIRVFFFSFFFIFLIFCLFLFLYLLILKTFSYFSSSFFLFASFFPICLHIQPDFKQKKQNIISYYIIYCPPIRLPL